MLKIKSIQSWTLRVTTTGRYQHFHW